MKERRMRQKVVVIALGMSLALGSVGTALAQDGQERAPADARAAARKALADWCAYTMQNWSIQGYSSAADMRANEGNSQSEWWTSTAMIAGSPCGT
jgi:hypothetical protein